MIASPLIWGLLLGLGSSLHCAGMCGPIGCSLLALGPQTEARQALLLRVLLMQAGRIAAYVLLGLVAGLAGARMLVTWDLTPVHQALQWAAASVVVWLGLATAGLVPSLALGDRMLIPLAQGVARLRLSLSSGGPEFALLGGMVWGMTPCAMVYTALFNSLLTGDAAGGALLMLAFGMGTIPAVAASSLALYGARLMPRPGRQAAGLLMVGAGILALALTVPGSPLCLTNPGS